MDPLSIAAATASVGGATIKAMGAIFEFSHEANEAMEDLNAMTRELQTLDPIIGSLTRQFSGAPKNAVMDALTKHLECVLGECTLVILQIEEMIRKFQREGAWTRTQWVVVGRADLDKLRSRLEGYKSSLEVGLGLITAIVQESIKEDTNTIRNDVEVVRQDTSLLRTNTDEILARINSLRYKSPRKGADKVEEWMETITAFTSCGESMYQKTIIDMAEDRSTLVDSSSNSDQPLGRASMVLGKVQELGVVSLGKDGKGGAVAKYTPIEPHTDSRVACPVPSPGLGLERREEPSFKAVVPVIDMKNPFRLQNGSRKATMGSDSTFPSTEIVGSREGAIVPMPANTPATRIQYSPRPRVASGFGSSPRLLQKGDSLDLVVACDVGDKSAAVAWMARNTSLQVIRHWPGGTGSRVPTLVVCDEHRKITSWGFQCANDTGPGKELHQCAGRRNLGNPDGLSAPNIELERHYLASFLRQLYAHVRQTISYQFGLQSSQWAGLAIEFHFTLPDRIRPCEEKTPSSIIESAMQDLKDVVREAGIGTGGPRHCAVLGPTESEAAAVAMLKPPPPDGETPRTFLLKVGGTEATVVKASYEQGTSGKTLHYTSESVARTRIAALLEESIRKRLDRYPEVKLDPDKRASGLLLRCPALNDIMGLLDGTSLLREAYWLRIGGVSPNYNHTELPIDNGRMGFFSAQVKALVEEVVRRTVTDIKAAMKRAGINHETDELVIFETAETPSYLAKRVIRALQVPYDPEGAADLNVDSSLQPIPIPPTVFGDTGLTAVEGIILRRNVWSSVPRPAEKFLAWSLPRVYVELRTPYDFLRDHSRWVTRPLCPHTPIKFNWDIGAKNKGHWTSEKFHLDVYTTFDTDWEFRPYNDKNTAQATKICTATWVVTPDDFANWDKRVRWYKKKTKFWSAVGEIRLYLLHPTKVGPQFEFRIGGSASESSAPESVVWECEPPHIVWPKHMVG